MVTAQRPLPGGICEPEQLWRCTRLYYFEIALRVSKAVGDSIMYGTGYSKCFQRFPFASKMRVAETTNANIQRSLGTQLKYILWEIELVYRFDNHLTIITPQILEEALGCQRLKQLSLSHLLILPSRHSDLNGCKENDTRHLAWSLKSHITLNLCLT